MDAGMTTGPEARPSSPLGSDEAQYQLAARLVDYMRLGEAIRILEQLGDYRNSAVLLKEVREIKAYSDAAEEARLQEIRRAKMAREQQAQAEARRHRRRFVLFIAAALLAFVLLIFQRR